MLYPGRLDNAQRQIRLLTVSEHDENGLLSCNIRTASLDDVSRPFTALSYVWGEPSITEAILVNGKTFEATTNLELALRSLRGDLNGKSLWVDAICINQQDIEERSQQVPLMRLLYSRAERVIIWLGQEDLAIKILMKEMENFESWSLFNTRGGINDAAAKPRHLTLLKRTAVFAAIARRPWWERVWVRIPKQFTFPPHRLPRVSGIGIAVGDLEPVRRLRVA